MTDEQKDEFLAKARKRLKEAIDAEAENRALAVKDLYFVNGEQWPEGEATRRAATGRLMLTVNRFPTLIKQVVGDQRQNGPQIKIRPSDEEADPEIAIIRQGMVRNIEYQSKAETVYDMAFESAVTCGYGAWRVITEYENPMSFNQVIRIVAIPNALTLYLDPAAKSPVGSDAEWGFLLEKMSTDAFKDKHPNIEVPSSDNLPSGVGMGYEHWWDKDTVTKAEYFIKEKTEKTIVQLSDGRVMEKKEAEALIAEIPVAEGVEPLTIKNERTTHDIKVMQYIINGVDIIDGPNEWPGKFIPFVPVYGEEMNIEGKVHRRGLIRHAKDPAMLYNFWTTLAAETAALAPKTPYIGTAKQFKNYENDWVRANTENMPYLKYDPDGDAPPPQRTQGATVPTGLLAERSQAGQDIEETSGMFRASVGAPSNEKSGKAIRERKMESDVGTFAYIDNLSRAIEHTGRIIDDLFGKIYDTDRDVRIKNEDDTESVVPINTTAGAALQKISGNPERYKGLDASKLRQQVGTDGHTLPYNDLSKGEYSVVVTVGPSYTTQRQEAAEMLINLAQAVPQIGQFGADILMRNQDFKGAEELADRLEKTLPEGMRKPKEGEPPAPPPGPTPEQEIEMEKLQLQKAELQLKAKELQIKEVEAANKIGVDKMKLKEAIAEVLNEAASPEINQ